MPTPTSYPTSGIVSGATTGQIANWYGVNRVVNTIGCVSSSVKAGNYTMALSDTGEVIEFDSALPVTVNVPPTSLVAFPVGAVLSVCQYGVGTLTVAAGAGVTIRTASSLTTRAQYSEASLRKRGTDEWVLSGDLV
jgi:hypothetical protein